MNQIAGCEILLEMRGKPAAEQMARKDELNEAFKLLLSQHPTEEQFACYMHGVVLTATMFYHGMQYSRRG